MIKMAILDPFSSHPFLSGLSDQDLMLLASGVQPFQAAPGKVLGHEGEPAHALYVAVLSRHLSALRLQLPDLDWRLRSIELNRGMCKNLFENDHRVDIQSRNCDLGSRDRPGDRQGAVAGLLESTSNLGVGDHDLDVQNRQGFFTLGRVVFG